MATRFDNSRNIIQAELSGREKLLWSGRPISKLAHAKGQLMPFLLGIPFLAFAIFWTSGVSGSFFGDAGNGPPGIFFLFGALFVVVGIYQILTPLIAAFKSGWLTYGLTNERLIIVNKFLPAKVRSWPINQVTNLVRNGSGEVGDVIFGEDAPSVFSQTKQMKKVGFIGIENPKLVEEYIRAEMKHLENLSAKG